MIMAKLLLNVFLVTLCTIDVNVALPNIIFMLIDDLGWNDLSYHNGSDYPTPNIDKLASNALELNNYYIQVYVTSCIGHNSDIYFCNI